MNTVALIKTTALAGIVAMMPVVFAETADAGANIKIKPKVKTHVKVKPKIKINKAKIRNNAKSNNQQVVVKSKKKSPQITVAPKPAQKKPVITASLNPGYPDVNIVPVPEQRPEEFDAQLGQFEELQAAREAAEAAGELEQLANLGDSGSDLGMKNPDLETGHSSNQDVLDGMFKEPGIKGFGDSNAAEFGPDSFTGLPNSHGQGPANSNGTSAADAAAGFWGVTQDRINAAIGGIAGKGDAADKPMNEPKDPGGKDVDGKGKGGVWTWGEHTRVGGNHVYERSTKQGFVTRRVSTTYNSDHSEIVQQTDEIRSPDHWRVLIIQEFSTRVWTVSLFDHNGDQVFMRVGNLDENSPYDLPQSVVERRDPDSGHAGPSPFPWINERENQLTKLTPGTGGKTPGGLTQDPAATKGGNANSTQAAVSLNDITENWDEDGRRSGSPQPIERCFHSEC